MGSRSPVASVSSLALLWRMRESVSGIPPRSYPRACAPLRGAGGGFLGQATLLAGSKKPHNCMRPLPRLSFAAANQVARGCDTERAACITTC